MKDPDDVSYLSIRNCIFAFKCSAKWDKLDPTSDDNIRFCQDCEKEVYFCEDDEQLVKLVKLNRCVSFIRDGNEFMGDIIPRLASQS